MSNVVRRSALGYSSWLSEWKRGTVTRQNQQQPQGGIMADDLLGTFFERYPSALGNSHVGGQYRIICPECGHIVPVDVLSEENTHLTIHCDNCDYRDELPESAMAKVPSAA